MTHKPEHLDRWRGAGWRLLLCAGAWLGAGALVAAAPADPLVDQLASDDWRIRQDAVDRLVAVGDDALPDLRQLVERCRDSEVRLRAEGAIARILDNRLIGASLITLKLDKAPASRAIEELARQAHAKLQTDPPGLLNSGKLKSVTLDANHRPFWEVLQSISRQTGLSPVTINKHNRDIGLGLSKGDPNWSHKPLVLAGPLLIRADRLTRISTITLRERVPDVNEFTASFTVFAEPKLKVIDFSGQLKLLKVEDEKGQSLIDPDAPAEADFDVMGSASSGSPGTWETTASLGYPRRTGERIAVFRASVFVEVQLRSARFEAPVAGGSGMERTVEGVRMKLKSLDSNRCLVNIFRDGRTEFEWQRLRVMLANAEACLLDDKDRVMARSQHGVDADFSQDAQRMDLRMRFGRDGGESNETKQKRGDAVKLVWEFPAETRVLNIPFEFRDLPIPR